MLECSAIKHLNDFIVLADTGNYTQACDRLYLSKSTLTKHIRDLEASLEHKLFVQSGHKLVLTEFGKFFLDYARRFTTLDDEYEQARTSWEEDVSSEVRIAVAAHMNCDHMVNMLWDHFSQGHPQYHLSTIEYQAALLSREDLFAMGYELVFALSALPTDKSCGCFTWAESELTAVLPLSHALAAPDQGRTRIRLQELAAEPFVLPPRETALHQMVVSLCQQASFTPRIDFTIHGNANLAELVSGNVGVSISTENDIPAKVYAKRVALIPLDPPSPVYLNLYYRKDLALSASAKAFLNYAMHIHRDHSMDIPYYGPEAGIENPFFK
ncbi:MAG: LysR family transcriptional regulator [Clostridiales bacterium]|nr:LysR family transcriptional regulator [Clostridiales bacterium]